QTCPVCGQIAPPSSQFAGSQEWAADGAISEEAQEPTFPHDRIVATTQIARRIPLIKLSNPPPSPIQATPPQPPHPAAADIPRMSTTTLSGSNLRAVYDKRYAGDYRESLSGYEYSRFRALGHFIPHVVKASKARRVLDYGCGSGLHIPLWESVFPSAELHFAD